MHAMPSELSSKEKLDQELSSVLVKLLQGFIHREERSYWNTLITHQESVREYFHKLGLYLFLEMEDGYAYLKSDPGLQEEHGTPIDAPSLIRKIPLSLEVSLLCVLLREALEQFDETVSEDHRLILNYSDIHSLLKDFYSDRSDETKLKRRFEGLISKVVDLGFLKPLKGTGENYEVTRPIKAFIDASQLKEIRIKMKEALHE